MTARIVRVSRVVSDLARAEAFYREAIGFRAKGHEPVAAATLAALGAEGTGAEASIMQLGSLEIALVRFASPGRPYPPESQSHDLWFQHLAIIVHDMAAAYAHLCGCEGWQPISDGGPQTLPPSNGRVQAFKFRDPNGHPLELIHFPGRHTQAKSTTLFLGIDHTALSITQTSRSVAFYSALGLHVRGHSLNHGPAQARLDGLRDATADITSLRSDDAASIGVELLAYRPPGRPVGRCRPNDVLTDWVTLSGAGIRPRATRDPDGHLLLLDQGDPTGAPA